MAWKLRNLIESCNSCQAGIVIKDKEGNGKKVWVPARPLGPMGLWGFKERLKDAWGVLNGKYEAFKWPYQ